MLCGFAAAIRASAYFFDKLAAVKSLKEIIYVPGNHDHSLFWQHTLYNQLIAKLKGKQQFSSDDLNFIQSYDSKDETFLNVIPPKIKLSIHYPFFKADIKGKKYLFFHGHFLDRLQTLQKAIIARVLGRIKAENLQQLCIFNAGQYETLTILGQCEIGRAKMRRRMHEGAKIFRFFFGKNSKSALQHEAKIEKFLQNYCGTWSKQQPNNTCEVLDFFVFGHTHKAGVGKFDLTSGRKAISVNSGCWFRKPEKRKYIGDFIVVDESTGLPALFNLTAKGAAEPHPDSINYLVPLKPPSKKVRIDVR
jgi:UDP-2,3-diacylglucosamine pyrophosphatase LpxH